MVEVKYLFIDGGFLDSLYEKTKSYFAIQDIGHLDYRKIIAGYQRTLYYDAFPAKKENETDVQYKNKVDAKLKKFAQINRIPFVHTREGLTRNRTGGGTRLMQKGVDILLAIDVYKHASLGNIREAHIMATDLDFFPLFEALRDTPVSTHLHCYSPETSQDLMFLADRVVPINPFNILQWCRFPNRIQFVEWNVNDRDVALGNVIKEGTFKGLPFYIYESEYNNQHAFYGRAEAHNRQLLMRAKNHEHIIWDFEARLGEQVLFT